MLPWFYFLSQEEQLLVQSLTGRYVVNGPRAIFLPLFHRVMERRAAISLSANQYLHVRDILSGEIHMVEGPCLYFLPAFGEVILQEEARTLAGDEFVRVVNRDSGEIRIVHGEGALRLKPFEQVLGKVSKGIFLDQHQAVVVRDLKTGSQKLVQDNRIFFPAEDEQVEDIRQKIRLEEHQVMVLKDSEGKFHYRYGTDAPPGFFVPPYWEVLKSVWSSGLHKSERNLIIHQFDLRPKFMWYEFDVRTRDNVELKVNVTFFWQIVNVPKLVQATDDAPGDVCSHARSLIIQIVSTVEFAEFLARFNELVQEAVQSPEDLFYADRGILIHSVEVREIGCKDKKTQDILSEIIAETTNRLNRIQKQVSENEILMKRLEGELAAEEAQQKLLDAQLQRFQKEAASSGEREAVVVREFISCLGPDMTLEQKIRIYEALKRKETLATLANQNTKIFLTRDDVQLKLDVHS